jgi:Concanavalin A-like lectin/glucanases superfamily
MKTTRRQFLGTMAVAGAVPFPVWAQGTERPGPPTMPPHFALRVAGVHGYAERESVRAGETIEFHVSRSMECRVEIRRLGLGVDDPDTDAMVATLGTLAPEVFPIHPGSYVHVARSLPDRLKGLTVEAWVRPWRLDRLVGVISQEDKQSDAGFALGVGKDGYVGFFLGNGKGPDEAVIHRTAPGVVRVGVWHHLVATWDGRTKRVWVDGVQVGEWRFEEAVDLGDHSLRLGAMGDRGEALRFLDGDLAMCVVRDRALDATEIQRRFTGRGLESARGTDVLGCWTFAEERGGEVRDVSPAGRHGRVVNHGTWMIGGPSFDAAVPRFEGYDPAADVRRGHGLRLASDDLYDCRWPAATRWQVPKETKPGIHVVRCRWSEGGRERQTDITFVVRPAADQPAAPILVLCSTNTWRAYNGAPFGVWPETRDAVIGTDGLPNAAGDPPAFCLYRPHAAGQGTYQLGLRMPWPVAGPHVLYGGPTRYSHLMRAERFLHAWLERSGYRFELATDLDLHRDPGLLKRHRCVVLNGHSEYWSEPAWKGLEGYLAGGGNVVVLSGNTLFWRVSFDAAGTVMECRKMDAPGDQVPASRRGEGWHAQDGRRGGLLRECGLPGWKLVGLETLGWNNQGNPKNFGPYVVQGADHFLFHRPEETGLKAGDRLGMGPDGGLPLANGHEFDVRLSTLKRLQEQPSPAGTEVPADPAGIALLANGVLPWKEGGSAFDFFFRPIRPKEDQGGEMIYWERAEGGRVFNAGAIGSGWALASDGRFQGLMRNVLHHFGVRRE